MAKKIKVDVLSKYLSEELTAYHAEVNEKVDRASSDAVRALVRITRKTAPRGKRGKYAKKIAQKRKYKTSNGSAYVWYVMAPEHRLTHLLVHGHATKDGGRTKSDPFLKNALDEVLPDYENAVKEALQNGS